MLSTDATPLGPVEETDPRRLHFALVFPKRGFEVESDP